MIIQKNPRVPQKSKLPEIERLLAGHPSQADEAKVVATFREVPTEDLGYILGRLDLDRLMDKVDDHLLGMRNKTDLIKTLCRLRLNDVTVENRVRLVDALQRGRTDSAEEGGIRDIFLGTRQSDLTRLKNGIDGGGDYHDLQELVHHDIDDPGIRSQILDHIAAESCPGKLESKVLSDIDDTFYANWIDKSYPKQTVYPGVLQFYQELDLGDKRTGRDGDKVFVTARPGERSGTIKDYTIQSLSQRGVAGATVLAGSLSHLMSKEKIAEMKYTNFQQYRELYPESPFVFIGDSGQGDVQFSEAMLATPAGNVQAAFIHDVVDTPAAQREEFRQKGIYFFDTYLGSAVDAYDLNLIHKDGLARIAHGAIESFDGLHFDDPAQAQARRSELQRDLERLNQKLPADEQVIW